MFPVQCVLLTIFKPHPRSFAEDSYKRVNFRVTKLYSITSRNDRSIQAEQLLVKWAEDGQENCLPGVGGCMKAHKWGEANVCDPVVTSKHEWGQHSDQSGHCLPTSRFTDSPILAPAASYGSDRSQRTKTLFILCKQK